MFSPIRSLDSRLPHSTGHRSGRHSGRNAAVALSACAALLCSLGATGCNAARDASPHLDLATLTSPAAVGQDNGSLVANWPDGPRHHTHARLIVDASIPQRHASHHSF